MLQPFLKGQGMMGRVVHRWGKRGVSACQGLWCPSRSALRGWHGSQGQLLHKQEAPVFAQQTLQPRGAECVWDEPKQPSCPSTRSISRTPPPHTHSAMAPAAPHCNRACCPAHPEWRHAPNMAPRVGALQPLPALHMHMGPQPAGSRGLTQWCC